MQRILLITMTAALFAQSPHCLAQKSEPPTEPPAGAAPGVGQSTVARGSRRATSSAVGAPTSLGVQIASGTTTFSNSKGDSIPPVMIRFSQPDVKTSAGLEEDLFVMARVISRTLDRADAENGKVLTRMGVPMLLTGSGRSVRPIYLEGLGPLFMIKVSFALMPPTKVDEKAPDATAPDSEWDEAQRDVFGGTELTHDETFSSRGSAYNEEQVEMLKKELIGAMKNAARIRGLKAEEFVSVAVFGPASSMYVAAVPSEGESNGTKYSTNAKGFVKIRDAGGASKGTVLTLRAKKKDIDDFAEGKLDAQAFKGKVTATTYFGSGAGASSINSWIQEKSSSNRFQ